MTAAIPPTKKARRWWSFALKGIITALAFYALLSHKIQTESGESVSILTTIRTHLMQLTWAEVWPALAVATGVKMIGIACSMWRWHLLLVGQHIRFNFGHIVGTFLIGRFLGTFLPSTVGLDGYKLYDAARFSGRVVEPAAATLVEKLMGLSGIFLTFMICFPLGYGVLGEAAPVVAMLTLPLALALTATLFIVLTYPGWTSRVLRLLPLPSTGKIATFVRRLDETACAYRGQKGRLALAMLLSFLVHFCTAAMYYFTARAVGALTADFWEVSFASSIQILATVVSPFTIAGEGVREAVQALLLASHIGHSASILSAALGFWAAEAVTLVGAFFLWARRDGYRPKRLSVGPAAEDASDSSKGLGGNAVVGAQS